MVHCGLVTWFNCPELYSWELVTLLECGGRQRASICGFIRWRANEFIRYSVASMPKDKSSAFGVWVGKGEGRREKVEREKEEDRTFI